MASLLAVVASGALAQDNPEFTYSGDVNAPDFPADADWINASGPISIADLQGKIVILDFWTYGCINCIHVIPDLKRLEAEYPTELVVIGVHSAKFENEGETENIRRIVRRYEVEHPVLNDNKFITWDQYGVRAWPTFMVIDPLGKVVGQMSGEPLYDRMAPIISVMAAEYSAAGLINPDPLPQWQPEMVDDTDTPLRFPGKVLADSASNRLFIADSNHNRIVVAALDTFAVQQIVGAGEAGLTDGDFATAQFFRPQGLTLVGNVLYVADTENHAIRAVDFDAATVTTVAGTGTQGFNREASGPGPEMDLSSPWDVVAHDGKIYIAMAGPHQLWVYDMATGAVGPYAGSGREDLIDGTLAESAWNQPSGIDTDGTVLYVADPEASAIRMADLMPGGEVKTIVGTGLFNFGDEDGIGDDVLLQHALGITVADDGLLYVADTYNNKIKRIDPTTRESVTIFGLGVAGNADGTNPLFYEPGGLDYADGKLYIADTNNHVIRVADLASGAVRTVEFPNAELLLTVDDTTTPDESSSALVESTPIREDAIFLAPQVVRAGEGLIEISVIIPDGYELNDQAPFTAIWPDNLIAQIDELDRDYRVILPDLPVTFPVTFRAGQTELALDLTIYWCEGVNKSLCFVDKSQLVLPLTVLAEADANIAVFERTLVPPTMQDTLDW
ncbi:MAG: redoxin domain-containing protein [Anaerolineae bacterium]|nr:redoxin domain-containing protein [Anaerolineae bacterium]